MEGLGYVSNERCGGHVHIGADYLNTVDEFKELLENIRLYGRTVQMAHELGQIKEKIAQGKSVTKEEEEKLKLKNTLKKDIPEDEKMEALMRLLFDEEEKKVYQKRYNANKLAEYRMEKLKFGKVDFENIYHNVEIPKDIISNLSNIRENRNINGQMFK